MDGSRSLGTARRCYWQTLRQCDRRSFFFFCHPPACTFVVVCAFRQRWNNVRQSSNSACPQPQVDHKQQHPGSACSTSLIILKMVGARHCAGTQPAFGEHMHLEFKDMATTNSSTRALQLVGTVKSSDQGKAKSLFEGGKMSVITPTKLASSGGGYQRSISIYTRI